MATLIQSKQIQGVVTASVIEGDFSVQGQIIATGSASIFADITASSISSSGPIYGVRYDDVQGTPNFIGGSGVVITQVGDNITITNLGAPQLITSIDELNSYTGSNDIIILGLQSQIDSLIAQTGSYETKGRGIISGSSQLTSSLDSRYALSGSHTDITSLNQFSSSIQSQVDALIRATSSYSTTDLTGSDSQTLSFNQVSKTLTIQGGNTVDLSSLGGGVAGGSSIWSTGSDYYYVSADLQVTGSFSATSLTGSIDYSNLTNIPSGIVSSSEQVLGGSGILSGSHIDTSSFATTGSNTFVGTQYFSGSLIPESSITDDGIHALGSVTNPWKELYISTASLNFVNDEGVVKTLSLSDIVTFDNHVALGSISSSAQITALGFISESNQPTDISLLNEFTQSVESRLSQLESQTGSYLTSETDNQTLSIVGDQLTISGGNTITIPTGSGGGTSDFTQLTNVPSGLVSSSDQINLAGVGGFSSYFTSVNDAQNVQDTRLTSLESFTASLDSTYATDSDLTSLSASIATEIGNIQHTQIPIGTISSSQQISDLGFVTSSGASGERTDISSLNNFTSSIDGRLSSIESTTSSLQSQIDSLVSATSSYLTSETDNQTLTIVGDQLTISSGNTITIPTGSNTTLPSGLISSSDQVLGGTGILSGSHTDITSLNQFTSSVQTEIDGLSSLTSSYLTELPSDLVSGSVLRTLDGTDVLSGSILPGTGITIDSSSGDYVITSTGGAGDTSFDGNREVTNTLLGDLFSQSYNAGTSGSIQDFLNQMFFPSYAPTATFTNQTGNWNENLATDGTNLVSISVSDTVDDSPYVVTLSGTNGSSFTPTPTNAASSSWELRANGNLTAGTYSYDVIVTDKNSASRTYSSRTIVVDDANLGTLTPTGTFYIIESATSGQIYLGSSGRSGAQGGVIVSYSPNYGSQVVQNFTSSNPLISISSAGVLSVGSPISGSGNVSGDIITSTIGWVDQYGNSSSDTISVNVTQNNAPDIIFTNTDVNLNTNKAKLGGGTLTTISFTDIESDALNHNSFQFTDTSGQLTATKSGDTYLITANSNLSGSTNYTIGATIEDVHGFRSNTESHVFTIVQGSNGTLAGDTTMYIIESALTNDSFRDATGFGNGNTAQVSVTYSPSAGSQIVQSYNSSNPSILIDSSGNMTLGVNLSGSVTQSGDSFTSIITFQDQYGNIGSGSVTANVFANGAPSVTFVSSSNYNTDVATSNSNAGVITISDTESNSPYNVVLGGTAGGNFIAVPQNVASSSWQVQPTGSLTANTYSLDISVTDTYGKSSTLSNKSIVVDEVVSGGTVYVYNVGQQANNIEYNVGILSVDSSTPPALTPFNGVGFVEQIIAGNLGNSSFTYSWGETKTATLAASGNGSNVHSVLRAMGDISYTNSNAFVIIIPTDLGMTGVPTSMTDGYGDNTLGRYVLEVGLNGGAPDGANTIEASTIYSVTLSSDVNGTRNYYVISTNNAIAPSTSLNFALNPASGSGGV